MLVCYDVCYDLCYLCWFFCYGALYCFRILFFLCEYLFLFINLNIARIFKIISLCMRETQLMLCVS